MVPPIPAGWQAELQAETEQPYFHQLEAFLAQERARYTVYPPEEDVFNALRYTPLAQASVLLLGQDPYHGPGQAHGLSFSVRPGVPPPPSLINIFKELQDDLGCRPPGHGTLTPWAEQGVLLLNAVLTVRAHQPNSHKGRGWEQFTDQAIRALNEKPQRVVFLLWGAYAQKKATLITGRQHVILRSPHPSPLSAARGFFGSRPFSQTNRALREAGRPEIDWQLPTAAG